MQTTTFYKFAITAVMAISLLLGITSCSDDDEKKGPYLYLPEKIVIDDEGSILTHTFSYDNELRLKGVTSIDSDGDDYLYTIEYDTHGRISKVTYKWGITVDTHTYTYTENGVDVLRDKNGSQSTKAYSVSNDGLVTYCLFTSEYDMSEIFYRYDGGDRLIGISTKQLYQESKEAIDITYNFDAAGMATDINMSNTMAVTLWDIDDDLFTMLLTRDGSCITSIKDIIYDEVSTYSYTTDENRYPTTYTIVKTTDEGDFIEYTATVTYKKIEQK